MSKILILANHYNTLRIFRRELLKQLSAQGETVIVSIPDCDEENKNLLKSYGCGIVISPIERRGMNPFTDIKLLFSYMKLIDTVKPDKVVTYTIKPNIYGSVACDFKKIPHYANITGLGSAFQTESFMKKMVSAMYKFSLKKAVKIFFENTGSRDTLVSGGIVKKEQTVVMAGAGVNLDEFAITDYPEDNGRVQFLFVGRIMREKGVDELFSAIRKIKSQYPNTEFEFIGWYEDDYEQTVSDMQNEGLIKFYGFQNDVKPYIAKAHCVILPSWHEGMSNTLLEGASMCRPLITNDIFGCKEAVIDGETGFIAHLRDAESLANAIEKFILLPYEKKKEMGLNGRRHMEKNFDKKDVVNKTLTEMGM